MGRTDDLSAFMRETLTTLCVPCGYPNGPAKGQAWTYPTCFEGKCGLHDAATEAAQVTAIEQLALFPPTPVSLTLGSGHKINLTPSDLATLLTESVEKWRGVRAAKAAEEVARAEASARASDGWLDKLRARRHAVAVDQDRDEGFMSRRDV